MHRLIIHKLGPIDNCELTCTQFMAFIGFQASGKSTIAKVIFFFQTIKDDIYTLTEEIAYKAYHDSSSQPTSFKNQLIVALREKFMRVFGSSWAMDKDMRLEYYFTPTNYIIISLKNDLYKNYIWIEFSHDFTHFLNKYNAPVQSNALGIYKSIRQELEADIQTFLGNALDVVYIPAGRSMLTLLSQQLSYIYTTMKDDQKRTLDYCTQNYIERILSLKAQFSQGLEALETLAIKNRIPQSALDLALNLSQKILRGKYYFSDTEERIAISNDKYVKINFASSGQQESVWILNLLYYYLLRAKHVMFIIEEPESHLFPESQKYITELIALIANFGHSVVITTHSPYVLGTLNNLLYASQAPSDKADAASHIISKHFWIDPNSFRAWFVRNHVIENCVDPDINLIQNEKIDEISQVINQDFDKIFELLVDE